MRERRALVCDDDVHVLAVLRRAFVRRDWTVSCVQSAARLRSKLADERFDLVIVDLILDEWGIGLLPEIAERQPHATRVLLTALGSPETHACAVAAGAHRVIVKPIVEAQLFDALEQPQQVAPAPDELRESLEDRLRREIAARVVGFDGNLTHAAESLGLHRQALQRMLRSFMRTSSGGGSKAS